jgi:hypothetical protein
MWQLLKPLKWLEKETGKVLVFTGSTVSECGKDIEDLGEKILQDLEKNKYIAKIDAPKSNVKNATKLKKKDKNISSDTE